MRDRYWTKANLTDGFEGADGGHFGAVAQAPIHALVGDAGLHAVRSEGAVDGRVEVEGPCVDPAIARRTTGNVAREVLGAAD